MAMFRLCPEEPIQKSDLLELAATVERSGGELWRLWFRFPSTLQLALTRNADPFDLAVLCAAKFLDADTVKVLHLTTSVDVTGDYSSVVGQGAAVVLKAK